MARRRVTIVYRFSPREDLYARTQRIISTVRQDAGPIIGTSILADFLLRGTKIPIFYVS